MARIMLVACAFCGISTEKETGAVNRAKKRGNSLYCNRTCAGKGRRIEKTKAQKVEEKRIYDEQYRTKNSGMLKKKKADYFQRTYDPTKAAIERQKTMARHVEYCRQPEYRVKKKAYDRIYNAKKDYGELWEVQLLIKDIFEEVGQRESKYQIRLDGNFYNKTQKRKRQHERFNR